MLQVGESGTKNNRGGLVTPGNPQRCNSMIAERSIQLNFYVGLFTLGYTVFEIC